MSGNADIFGIAVEGVTKIINNGKTPAYIRWVSRNVLGSIKNADDDPWNYVKITSPITRSHLYIPPNGEEEIQLVFHFRFREIDKSLLLMKNLFMTGDL